MTVSKAIVMALSSGTILMTQVLHDSETSYVLKDAYELHEVTTAEGVHAFYFTRYLPFTNDGTILVHKTAVTSLALCSDKYGALYEKKLAQYEAANQSITDPDETAIMEGDLSDEESDDSDDDEDDYDPSGATPSRGPRTFH